PLEWIWLVAPQVLVVLVLAAPSLRRPLIGLEVYLTPTRSNTPTLDAGDRFVVRLGAVRAVRGEMVVFRAPDGTGQNHIKRIVAVAGDVVAGGPAGLAINGHRIRDHAVQPFGPVQVPAGHAFVIGDNLTNSRDSRHFGAIQESAITGRPLYVVWSKRWRKIGSSLR
ncbi:MAG: signal peptidase I, partial [Planctomycetota bacterium]|nr:signal peptidase I [Planctomycetota bacterium]